MTLPKSGSIQSFSSTFFKFEIFCAGFTWINAHNKALFFPKFVTFYLVLVISAYNIDIQIGVRNTIKLDRPNLVVDYLKNYFYSITNWIKSKSSTKFFLNNLQNLLRWGDLKIQHQYYIGTGRSVKLNQPKITVKYVIMPHISLQIESNQNLQQSSC